MANFTKRAIKASFLKLLNEQPLSKISVRDIVEDCGINRNSFYYHFQDIPTLIGEIIKEEMDNIIASFPTVNRLDECVEAIFHIAYENKRAVRNIYNSVNRDIYEHSVMQLCEYLVETYFKTAFPETKLEGSEKELAVRFFKCEIFGLFFEWVETGMKDSAIDEAHRIMELCRVVFDGIHGNSDKK